MDIVYTPLTSNQIVTFVFLLILRYDFMN